MVDASAAKRYEVVSKAVRRAAGRMGVASHELIRLLGGPDEIAGNNIGNLPVLVSDRQGLERAVVMIRIWRALEAVFSGDDARIRKWMRTPNRALGIPPILRLLGEDGLEVVAGYLEERLFML